MNKTSFISPAAPAGQTGMRTGTPFAIVKKQEHDQLLTLCCIFNYKHPAGDTSDRIETVNNRKLLCK
jgi:hypothetical protein